MKTLKLFNAVVAKKSNEEPYISDIGIVIEPDALWLKDKIVGYYTHEHLNGNDINKTFHKSWEKIKKSTRCELLIDQIKHYISTYGSGFKDEIYIPDEVLDIPDLKITYKVVKAYTKEQMKDKCLSLLRSGIALKEETVDDIISVLVDELDYTFSGKENIKNKEAIVKIAEGYHIYPDNPVEFFRYIIYRTTDTSLLIKSKGLINTIKNSSYNPGQSFKEFGLERLAGIFNRFKPLFLAYKGRCPKTINRIGKLSKKYHIPMTTNPLNNVTSILLRDSDKHWLENATPFALFKALSSCYTRMNGQDTFVYRIRNGKSWTQERTGSTLENVNEENYKFILDYIKKRFDLTGKKIFVPKNVLYALPTSEKMFVENIPTGTRFYGNKLAVGIYWENMWGARDLDISGINIGGKVGWNSEYSQSDGSLMYSGDITDAPNGAVEYLYASNGLKDPTLVMNNVFIGNENCGYKIIVGKGNGITRKFMMNPNNLFAEMKSNSVQKNTIIGIIIPEKNRQCFVLLNIGSGNIRVSNNSPLSNTATKALYQQWSNPISLNRILKDVGAKLVTEKEKADIDLSLEKLEKDTFINLFK